MERLCPNCTAPLPVDDGGPLPHCPKCEGEILVTRGEEEFVIVKVATPQESRHCHVTLEHLRTLGLRNVSGEDLKRIDVTPCPICSHLLRLENMGRVEVDSGILRFLFPEKIQRDVTCRYCGSQLDVQCTKQDALAVEVTPPARDSHELELEKFLDEKPIQEFEPAPSGGCVGSILLLVLLLSWIL